MKNRNKKPQWRASQGAGAALVALSLGMTGCGSSETTTSGSSDLTLSGTVASTTGTGSRVSLGYGSLAQASDSELDSLLGANASVNIADYSMYCLTLTTPPSAGKGAFGADGKFSLSIAGAKGKKLGCFIVDASDTVKATLVIKDTSSSDMNGNSKTSQNNAFGSNSDLGNIALDLDKGEAVADKASITSTEGGTTIAEAAVSAGEAFDPTGTWKIVAADFTLPTGYKGPNPANTHESGPPEGQELYMKRISGPSTADASKTVYGLMMWHSKTHFETGCGGKLGMTSSEASAVGVDLSGYGAALAPFTYSTSVSINGSSVGLTDGWKLANATSQYNMQDCESVPVTLGGKTEYGWKCTDTSGDYQIGLGGGCKNAAGTPVEVQDWNGFSCNSTGPTDGYYTSTCTGTSNSQAVTCTHKYGVFDSTGAATNPNNFNWGEVANLLTQGASCGDTSVGTDKQKLAKLKCYADAYWRSGLESGGGGSSSVCIPRIRTDWTASTPSAFVEVSNRPSSLMFFDKLDYSDATNASLTNSEDDFRGVQVKDASGNIQWIQCRVHSRGSINISKVSDTRMLVSYVETTKTSSLDKPACVAQYGSSEEKYMFYMDFVSQ